MQDAAQLNLIFSMLKRKYVKSEKEKFWLEGIFYLVLQELNYQSHPHQERKSKSCSWTVTFTEGMKEQGISNTKIPAGIQQG